MNTTDNTAAPTDTPTPNTVREELLKNTKRAQDARERLEGGDSELIAAEKVPDVK